MIETSSYNFVKNIDFAFKNESQCEENTKKQGLTGNGSYIVIYQIKD